THSHSLQKYHDFHSFSIFYCSFKRFSRIASAKNQSVGTVILILSVSPSAIRSGIPNLSTNSPSSFPRNPSLFAFLIACIKSFFSNDCGVWVRQINDRSNVLFACPFSTHLIVSVEGTANVAALPPFI